MSRGHSPVQPRGSQRFVGRGERYRQSLKTEHLSPFWGSEEFNPATGDKSVPLRVANGLVGPGLGGRWEEREPGSRGRGHMRHEGLEGRPEPRAGARGRSRGWQGPASRPHDPVPTTLPAWERACRRGFGAKAERSLQHLKTHLKCRCAWSLRPALRGPIPPGTVPVPIVLGGRAPRGHGHCSIDLGSRHDC